MASTTEQSQTDKVVPPIFQAQLSITRHTLNLLVEKTRATPSQSTSHSLGYKRIQNRPSVKLSTDSLQRAAMLKYTPNKWKESLLANIYD